MSVQSPISSINDFVVRFANVNGSGSASANELFARSILRHGVPVSPRNIFPSNIQGLPTWYEVRVTEAGHLGARGGVDMMVAMNPQTWDKDVASIEPGGYLLYDSTKPLPPSRFRDDIHVIGVPLTAICNREYTDPRQRQLFKNIIYVGALSALLDMDVPAIEKLVSEQFKGKEKLFDANKHALHLGRDWALLNLECPIGLRLKPADKVGDQIFMEGNSAAALGALYGGASVCAWYPITPSSSLADTQVTANSWRSAGSTRRPTSSSAGLEATSGIVNRKCRTPAPTYCRTRATHASGVPATCPSPGIPAKRSRVAAARPVSVSAISSAVTERASAAGSRPASRHAASR